MARLLVARDVPVCNLEGGTWQADYESRPKMLAWVEGCRSRAVTRGVAAAVFAFTTLWVLAPAAEAQKSPISDTEFIQYLLVWTGDYRGMVDGVLGPRSEAAVRQYWLRKFGQRPANAASIEDMVEQLDRDAEAAAAKFQFLLFRDQTIGVTFGLPRALFDSDQPSSTADSRRRNFQSIDLTIELEITLLRGRYPSLLHLFTRLTRLAGREVAYSNFQQDWFVVSGTDGSRGFYARYHGEGGEIRGFSFSYGNERGKEFEPVIIAMSNVFRPSALASDPLIDFLDQRAKQRRPSGPEPPVHPPSADSGTTSTGSGFLVDNAAHVLTNAHVVRGCTKIRVGGKDGGELVALDDTNDLALLRGPGTLLNASPLTIRSDGVRLCGFSAERHSSRQPQCNGWGGQFPLGSRQ